MSHVAELRCLSHTTDLVREDRAATRRANEFSSINDKPQMPLFYLEPEAFCAALQEGGLSMGSDPQSGYHGPSRNAFNSRPNKEIRRKDCKFM